MSTLFSYCCNTYFIYFTILYKKKRNIYVMYMLRFVYQLVNI
nr:MAG TPA: hypothetical protein [Bacteriophage sp.]